MDGERLWIVLAVRIEYSSPFAGFDKEPWENRIEVTITHLVHVCPGNGFPTLVYVFVSGLK